MVPPTQTAVNTPAKAQGADVSADKPAEPEVQVKEKKQSKLKKQLAPIIEMAKQKILTPPEGVSKQKHMTMLCLMPVLMVITLFVFGRMFLKSGGVKGNKNNKADTVVVPVAAKTEIAWQKPQVYPENLRDPMNENSVTTAVVDVQNAEVVDIRSTVVVRGIVYSKDNPAAVIGTEILRVGHVVEGIKIIEINPDSVTFEKDGETWTQRVAN